MTTIILVILGVLIAAVAALMVVYWGGDAWEKSKLEAEAGRLVSEGQQISTALELHYRQEGSFPRGSDPVEDLISTRYLTHRPLGVREQGSGERDRWNVNYDAGMVRLKIGDTKDDHSSEVCLAAREQLKLPAVSTATGIYRCDGSDSPGGKLGGREPCCIGEVAPGGGSVTPAQPPAPDGVIMPNPHKKNYYSPSFQVELGSYQPGELLVVIMDSTSEGNGVPNISGAGWNVAVRQRWAYTNDYMTIMWKVADGSDSLRVSFDAWQWVGTTVLRLQNYDSSGIASLSTTAELPPVVSAPTGRKGTFMVFGAIHPTGPNLAPPGFSSEPIASQGRIRYGLRQTNGGEAMPSGYFDTPVRATSAIFIPFAK